MRKEDIYSGLLVTNTQHSDGSKPLWRVIGRCDCKSYLAKDPHWLAWYLGREDRPMRRREASELGGLLEPHIQPYRGEAR